MIPAARADRAFDRARIIRDEVPYDIRLRVDRLISKIFLAEGWLISAIGAGSGLILGVILCYLQQEYGLLKLGSSEGIFITDAYPVRLELFDTVAVTLVVLLMGFVTAWYPAKFLRKRLLAAKSNRE